MNRNTNLQADRQASDHFVKASDILDNICLVDFHSHTTYVDGNQSVSEMICRAEEVGLKAYALTEHVRTSAMSWWPNYVQDIKRHRANANLDVFIGLEANAIGPAGNVDVPEQMLEDAELVLGSVHGYYIDATWEKIPDGSMSRSDALAYEVEKTIGLATNPDIDVLAHPGYIFERHYGDFPCEAFQEIIAAANEHGKAVEISKPFMKDPQSYYSTLISNAELVSIGSNAHDHGFLGQLKKYIGKYL